MGFSIHYRSARPVRPDRVETLQHAAQELCRGHSWLSCEPVGFFRDPTDGHLVGGSKPNLVPHLADTASAAQSGLPDGTTRDLLEILTRLSRQHRIDWEISHDFSDGPIGHIRSGVCDDAVIDQFAALANFGNMLGDMMADANSQNEGTASLAREDTSAFDDDEDGPSILPFRPRGG